MKSFNRAALVCALGACLGAFGAGAPAHAEGVYLRGEVMGGFGGKYTDVPLGDLDSSILYGAAVGTHVAPHVRLEGEYLHSDADFERGGGDSSANIGMVNAYYDFGNVRSFTPYVGVGVGYGRFEPTGGHDDDMTYSATAGVSKEFSPGLVGEVSYKFLGAPNLTIAGTDTGFRSNYLGAGLRVRLGS